MKIKFSDKRPSISTHLPANFRNIHDLYNTYSSGAP
jgi:hypothetical protein